MKRLLVVVVSLAVLIGCASSAAAGDLDNKLIQAIKTRNADLVRALLDQGASANAKGQYGIAALYWAAGEGKADIVRLLLDRGADVNAKCSGYTALMRAYNAKIVRLLLDKGANVNAKDNKGETALMHAAMAGNADVVRLLLKRGADVNAKDNKGKTALYWANAHLKVDVAKILKDAGGTATSVSAGDLGEQLIEAAEHGNADTVRALLKEGADVNAKDKNGDTALYWATFNDRVDVVSLLLDRGANANALNKNGITALMNAARNGKADVVRVLLDKGADVNAKDSDGSTALIAATAAYDNTAAVRIVRLLLDKGADVNAKDNIIGRTALIEAAMDGKAEAVRLLLDKGANVNAKDKSGTTPLMGAAICGRTDVVRLLLDKGANVNAKSNFSRTALYWAAYYGKADVVRLLLDKGADVNAKDKLGRTASVAAARRGHANISEMLKEAEGTATSAAAGKMGVAHAASPSGAKVPDGFVGIRWGANREQIIKAMHERGFTTKGTILPERGTPPSTLVFRGNFGGVNCHLQFYLKNNTFYEGLATYLGMFDPQPVQERIFKEMVSRIGQKYGPPQSDKIYDLKENDGTIVRGGDANWEFDDHASSEKYEIKMMLMPDGFVYFSHWNRTFGFVKIFYTDVSLEKRLQNQDF